MADSKTTEICPHCMGSGEGAASQPCWTCNGSGGVPQTTAEDVLDTLSIPDLKDALLYKLVSIVVELAPDRRDVKDLSDIVLAIGAKTP